jgi:hypothetical protein
MDDKEKLRGFFVEADNYYGLFAALDDAIAVAVGGQVCEVELHLVGSITREEYEREWANRPHLVVPTEQN